MIYSIGNNKIYFIEKNEIIEDFIYKNILTICNSTCIKEDFIRINLKKGTKNFFIFERNGKVIENFIDDFIIDNKILKNNSYCDVSTTTYNDVDECFFMFIQEINDYGIGVKDNARHLVFYNKNYLKDEEILSYIKKYDPST